MTSRRKPRRRLALASAALVCLAGVLPLLPAGADSQAPLDHAHRLGMKVRCPCGGCSDSAGGCYHVGGAFSGPCDDAKAMLRRIDARLAKGESDDLIIQSFVQEFGAGVLVEPPHSGFGGLAWWIPALAFIAGFTLVLTVISRWRKRIGPPHEPVLAGAGSPRAIPRDVLERARAQAARDTED